MSICRECLSAGKKTADGEYWACGDIHNTPPKKNGSLRVWLRGQSSGNWFDFATGEHGDIFDLIALRRYGGDKKKAFIEEVKYYYGHNAFTKKTKPVPKPPPPPEPEPFVPACDWPPEKRELRPKQREYAIRNFRNSLSIYTLPKGFTENPVASYLGARGIDVNSFVHKGGRIGKISTLKCAPWFYDHSANANLPSMLAFFIDATGIFAMQRTALSRAPEGHWVKTKLTEPKKHIGKIKGGIIPVWNGMFVCAKTNRLMMRRPLAHADPDETVYLTEGVEDALSIAWANPEYRVCATGGMFFFAHVWLPKQIRSVCVMADNDSSIKKQQQLKNQLMLLKERGLTVECCYPPHEVKDWNELIQNDEILEKYSND